MTPTVVMACSLRHCKGLRGIYIDSCLHLGHKCMAIMKSYIGGYRGEKANPVL